MRVESMSDVASAVRGRRLDLGLSQSELARRSGISRKWISEFEAGKPRAEFALVLRILETLGLSIGISEDLSAAAAMPAKAVFSAAATAGPSPGALVDLDVLLEEYRKG
jgi:HTH-type transcriptional regulator / antitoxin HipB